MIQTGDPILDSQINQSHSQTIGFFLTTKDLPKDAENGSRAIVIETNTTWEFYNRWNDLGAFILPMGINGFP